MKGKILFITIIFLSFLSSYYDYISLLISSESDINKAISTPYPDNTLIQM